MRTCGKCGQRLFRDSLHYENERGGRGPRCPWPDMPCPVDRLLWAIIRAPGSSFAELKASGERMTIVRHTDQGERRRSERLRGGRLLAEWERYMEAGDERAMDVHWEWNTEIVVVPGAKKSATSKKLIRKRDYLTGRKVAATSERQQSTSRKQDAADLFLALHDRTAQGMFKRSQTVRHQHPVDPNNPINRVAAASIQRLIEESRDRDRLDPNLAGLRTRTTKTYHTYRELFPSKTSKTQFAGWLDYLMIHRMTETLLRPPTMMFRGHRINIEGEVFVRYYPTRNFVSLLRDQGVPCEFLGISSERGEGVPFDTLGLILQTPDDE